jgi:hypothetical protein
MPPAASSVDIDSGASYSNGLRMGRPLADQSGLTRPQPVELQLQIVDERLAPVVRRTGGKADADEESDG